MQVASVVVPRWCGPCQMMAEILTQVGPQMKDELKIVKVGVALPVDFAVMALQVGALCCFAHASLLEWKIGSVRWLGFQVGVVRFIVVWRGRTSQYLRLIWSRESC